MVMSFVKKNLILIIYTVTLLSMFVFAKTANPIINYVRYAYVAFMGTYVVFKQRQLLFNKMLLVISVFLIGHTILFGFIMVPEELGSYVIDNARDLMLFWGFVIFSSQYVWKNGLEKQFLIASQIATSLFINFCYITNFNGIAPIKFLPQLFSGIGRVRFSFGLGTNNRAAYIALAAFILSVMVWRECFDGKKILSSKWKLSEIYVLGSICVSVLVLLSTQTRGAIIAAGMFLVLTWVMNNCDRWQLNFKRIDWKLYSIIIIILIGVYGYYVLFSADNRANFLTINLNVFLEYADNIWGMGYVPFSGFLTDAFGYGTQPIDCYYLYILCATGIVGSVMTFVPLLIFLVKSIHDFCRDKTTTLQNQYIGIFLVFIFVAFAESSFIAPYSPYSYVYWSMFFMLLLGKN